MAHSIRGKVSPTKDFASLNYPELAKHFGENTGNHKNSPLFVHMVAGLGTGLFLFDEDGLDWRPVPDVCSAEDEYLWWGPLMPPESPEPELI